MVRQTARVLAIALVLLLVAIVAEADPFQQITARAMAWACNSAAQLCGYVEVVELSNPPGAQLSWGLYQMNGPLIVAPVEEHFNVAIDPLIFLVEKEAKSASLKHPDVLGTWTANGVYSAQQSVESLVHYNGEVTLLDSRTFTEWAAAKLTIKGQVLTDNTLPASSNIVRDVKLSEVTLAKRAR